MSSGFGGDSIRDTGRTYFLTPSLREQNKCAFVHPICVNKSLNKFGWIPSSGFGGDGIKVVVLTIPRLSIISQAPGWMAKKKYAFARRTRERKSFNRWVLKMFGNLMILCLIIAWILTSFEVGAVKQFVLSPGVFYWPF